MCHGDGVGKDVEHREFSREDRMRYREKVRTNLDVLARMLAETQFEFERPLTGLEIELNLVDEQAEPAMRNAEVLDAIADPDFVTELGQFNIEINVPPRRAGGRRAGPVREADPGQPQRRRGARRGARRAHRDDRHPADAAGASTCTSARCRPTRATRCSTSRSSPPAARTC